MDLSKATGIAYVKDGEEKIFTVGSSTFMTESDVVQTCTEIVKTKTNENASSTYTLICNGGTKRIGGVSSVKICEGENKAELNAYEEEDEYYSNEKIYVPNYVNATEPSSGDNRVYAHTGYKTADGDIQRIRQYTHAIKYPDGAIVQKESKEYVWYNAYGQILKKRDAYGVTTEYYYDEYGNLQKTVLSGEGTDEKIVQEYTYEGNEYLVSSQTTLDGGKVLNKEEYEFNPLYGVTTKVKQSATESLQETERKYTYNTFNDRIQKVELSVGDNVYGKNLLRYDSNGRLCEGYSNENCKYTFGYDEFGRSKSFSLNGVELLTKEYDYDENTVTAKYHRSESQTDAIKTTYDSYGRVKKVTNNGEKVLTATYQDEVGEFSESPSCANVKRVTDGSTGQVYTYVYDEYTGRPTEYSVQNDEMSMKVFSTGGDKVKYEFDDGNLNYEDQITYDKNCLISPRITNAYNNSDWGMDWDISYDKLGRYVKRSEHYNDVLGECPQLNISYKAGTFLKEQIEYSKTNNVTTHKETIKQEYDVRGNILSIEDTNTFLNFKGTNKSVYGYDDVNRLIKEEITGTCAFTREYTYDEDGNVSSVKQGDEVESYTYEQGRLTSVKVNGVVKSQYEYDLFGNPVNYNGKTMTWERGTFLKTYNGITYTYDGHGNLYKKQTSARTTINYYDGNKLIAQKVGGKLIRYFYDLEGVAGFKIGTSDKYTYAKDAQGNVLCLFNETQTVARYVYDAWGNCKVLDKNGNEITEWDNPAVLNPFRWKSQYYDTDSGLYWIGQRWYDSEVGRYISTDNPEALLQNATVVYGLNLYAFCIENPVAVMIAANTFLPSLDLYYNGEYKTWWQKYGKWLLFGIGVTATIIACIAAPFTCGASTAVSAIGTTLLKIAMNAAVGAVVSLAIGGAVAGVISAFTGHGFWQAFGDSVSENFVEAVVTSFAFSAVSTAASNLIQLRQCFKEGTLVETEDGLKPIEEIEVGDKVLAYDEETQKQAYKPVKRLFRNETKEWYHVFVDGEEIICTGGHPFYVPDFDKYIPAKDLKEGMKLLLSNNQCVKIESIKVEKLSTPETTYNFEVEDFHTYYVSNSKVLVHNTCVKDLKTDTSISRDIQGEGKYGSYEITYESGNKYIGKGGQDRMWQSAARNANKYGDTVQSVKWRPSKLATNRSAFIQEAQWMKNAGWTEKWTKGFYNVINSPGFKYLK